MARLCRRGSCRRPWLHVWWLARLRRQRRVQRHLALRLGRPHLGPDSEQLNVVGVLVFVSCFHRRCDAGDGERHRRRGVFLADFHPLAEAGTDGRHRHRVDYRVVRFLVRLDRVRESAAGRLPPRSELAHVLHSRRDRRRPGRGSVPSHRAQDHLRGGPDVHRPSALPLLEARAEGSHGRAHQGRGRRRLPLRAHRSRRQHLSVHGVQQGARAHLRRCGRVHFWA